MKRFYFIAFIAVICLSCVKNSDPIPNVGVNFSISLLDSHYSKLRGANTSVTVNNVGVAGVIIYHDFFNGYEAYDRCSSYKPENRCAVTVDSTGFTAVDPCSGSKFSLSDNGSPVKGPATQSLKAYTVYESNDVVSVSN